MLRVMPVMCIPGSAALYYQAVFLKDKFVRSHHNLSLGVPIVSFIYKYENHNVAG